MEKKLLTEEEKLEEKDCLPSYKFPKSLKLRKSFEFKRLHKLKKRIYGHVLTVDYHFNPMLNCPKLGLSVPSKLGKAIIRNRFKRLVREVFRLNQAYLPKNLELNISAPSLDRLLTYEIICIDFMEILTKIKDTI